MSDYEVEIEGKYDLDQINLQIAGEEASASEFKHSKVSVRNNQVTNIVTFETLAAGTIPKPLKVVRQADRKPPPGTREVWSGVMVVNGSNVAVIAYRTA